MSEKAAFVRVWHLMDAKVYITMVIGCDGSVLEWRRYPYPEHDIRRIQAEADATEDAKEFADAYGCPVKWIGA